MKYLNKEENKSRPMSKSVILILSAILILSSLIPLTQTSTAESTLEDDILSVEPANEDEDVDVYIDVVIVFDREIDNPDIFVLTDNHDTDYIFEGLSSTHQTNDTLIYSHPKWLLDTQYNLTLSNNTDSYSWSFTTESFGHHITAITIDFVIWTFDVIVLFVAIIIIVNVFKEYTDSKTSKKGGKYD